MAPEITPEITPRLQGASAALLAMVDGLRAYVWASAAGTAGPALVLQTEVFVAGGFLIVFPGVTTRLAHVVGIGRGVDFVLYPLVIWLVRESLATRRRRFDDAEKLTEAVRAMAILT